MRKTSARLVATIFFLTPVALALAAEETPAPRPELESTEEFFQAARWEVALTTAIMFSPVAPAKPRPTVNYTMTALQLGYMLSDVKGSNWWRGNFEFAGEGFGGAIFDGEGDYVTGLTLWLRYNFVPEGWRVVPFLQVGAGMTYTDLNPNIEGQKFNFNLDAGAGLHYFVDHNWSINLEYRYQHISNGGMAEPNLGVNAVGPVFGVSWFF